jgi:hypothetical protein
MSYLTPAEAQSLLDTIGQNQFLSDEAVLVQCLFRASKIIDNLYGHLYPGVVLTSDQELLWPRNHTLKREEAQYAENEQKEEA